MPGKMKIVESKTPKTTSISFVYKNALSFHIAYELN